MARRWKGSAGRNDMIVTKKDLFELALETTGMSKSRWDLLLDALKNDAAMNLIMKDDWNRKPRDSEEAIREYYRKSDIWFLNTWNHGVAALIEMAKFGTPPKLSRWQETFVKNLGSAGTILDYGGGLFKDTWPLVMSGKKVFVAEVDGPVTAYLRRYIALTKLEDRIGIVGVNSDLPLTEMYDGIVSFETLEHVLRPVELTRHFHEHLRPSGPFVFSVSFGGPVHAPYHVASNAPLGDPRVWSDRLQKIGFRPFWKDEANPHIQMWRRS